MSPASLRGSRLSLLRLPSSAFASRLTCLLLTLFAFALRVHALDAKGLSYDEAATALMARATAGEIIAFHWRAAFEHPPVWQLLMHGWSHLVGQSEFALRYLSVLAGTLLIPLLYQLACRLTARHTPLPIHHSPFDSQFTSDSLLPRPHPHLLQSGSTHVQFGRYGRDRCNPGVAPAT